MTGVAQMQTQQTPAAPVRHPGSHWKHVWKKRLVNWARWSHIYLSMVSFAILFFFAATGLTLNHQEWFANQQRSVVYNGSMPREWLGNDVAKLEIVERLRAAHGIKASLGELQVDDGQVSLNFKGPGYTADAFIDRATGTYEMTENRMGWGAVINDLHRGRDAGGAWSMLVDASAIFMSLVSLTGLTLIFFLAKWRRTGLIALVVGAGICVALYVLFVP